MTGFSDLLGDMDAAIDTELCDDALFRPQAGGPDIPVRAALLRPSEEAALEGAEIVQTKPVVRVSVEQVPSLVRGDKFVLEGHVWRVCAAPKRPGRGRRWVAQVEDMGAEA